MLDQLCVAILLASFITSLAAATSGYGDCGTKLSTLESALYETGDNLYHLNSIFYPPSERTSRFIRVIYTFLNESGHVDGCNISYIWAIGGFLFFQPPTLFQVNSLFFNYPNNKLTTLFLKLPHECRPLIHANASHPKCSCLHDSEKLDILTQQIQIYAKYTTPESVNRENTFARSICAEDLENVYYSNGDPALIFVILCATIIMPLIVLLLITTSIRNLDECVINSFTSSSNHKTVVSLVAIGVWVTIGVLTCDVMACNIVVSGNHEYSYEITGKPINLYVVFGTLASDLIFIIPMMFCILYICIFYNGQRIFRELHCNMTCTSDSCISTVIAFILGKNTYKKIRKLTKNGTISLMFPLMLVTPVLCVSSHLGYIMLAWLTEPSKCTTTLITVYIFLLFLFFTFKRGYRTYSKIAFACNCLNTRQPDGKRNTEIAIGDDEQTQPHISYPEEVTTNIISKGCCCISYSRADTEHINTQTFCLLLFYGVFIIGIAVIIILIFVLLPLASEELVIYLFQVFQLLVVLVSAQFAYQLFFSESFTLESIMLKFKEVYANKGRNKKLVSIARRKHEEAADIAGEFAAEFTDIVINKVQ